MQQQTVNETLLSILVRRFGQSIYSTNRIRGTSSSGNRKSKGNLGKIRWDINKIEEEQKKLIEDIRESNKENIQKVFGQCSKQSI